MKRRTFVKNGTALSLGTSIGFNYLPNLGASNISVGIIGTGMRGRGLLNLLLQREDVDVKAICDIDGEALKKAEDAIRLSQTASFQTFGNGQLDWKNMLTERLDAVIIATPWRWHAPMAIEAMQAGMYVGVEVPLALSIEDCWKVVRTSQETGMPCMMLENVCYRRDVMAVLQMVRRGLFGELIHLEGGYQHDLRHVKFNNGKQPYGGGVEFGTKGYSEARWRTHHSINRNGDLYPTHGLGPLAEYANINYGNRIVSLSSFASKSRGLHNYIVKHGGHDHPNAQIQFKLGDVITTVLTTSNGETITLQHDTNLPRPYSLGFRVQGTQGIWMDVNKSIYIEDMSPDHQWEPAETFLKKYDHPLWKRYEKQAVGAGHGGMDYFVVHDFIQAVKEKKETPIDVYDSATWSVVSPLSEKSIQEGGSPQSFPDFTEGDWKTNINRFAQTTY